MVLAALDRFFNRVATSQYNPLYRSGTIALALMAIAMVTGLVLMLVYRVGAPYESMVAIQEQAWFGRWIRGVHRYASDAAVISVVLHVARMAAQGKSWGPRAFAWITGVGLMILMFLSGWTGFVLVWDEQGRGFAMAGAAILDGLGIFSEPIGRAFGGASGQPPASFFFMNLFLHVVIPLSMIFGVWFHTSRMANAIWLPSRRFMTGLAGLLVAVAAVFPPPLLEKADPLRVAGRIPLDWFYGFWLPWAERPGLVLAFWVGLVALLVSVPLWLKPRKEERPSPSFNDPNVCKGCRQCVQDCPYEAITMVPRVPQGSKSAEYARVDPALCVSCGICAASCDSFTIGPAGRKGSDQMLGVRDFLAKLEVEAMPAGAGKIVVLGCRCQPAVLRNIERFVSSERGFDSYPIECAGNLHASVVERLLKRYATVAIAACPPQDCPNKDAFRLLRERIAGTRGPTLSQGVDRARVPILVAGVGEESRLFERLLSLRDSSLGQVPAASPASREGRRAPSRLAPLVAGLACVGAVAAMNRVPAGSDPQGGVLRLSWRLPGQIKKTCRDRSAAELAELPAHMRVAQECATRPVPYRLVVSVDASEVVAQEVRAGGMRGDAPMYVEREIALGEGSYAVRVSFVPVGEETTARLSYEGRVDVRKGDIALIRLEPGSRSLVLEQKEPRS